MEEAQGWLDFEGALKVRLKIFEGPLDLLLHLIKTNKVDIYDIPVAEITAQYLEYLELMKDLNLDIASEFMVMAATLMHIKSRMLLPVHEGEEEEEDPRAELVAQLLEYQRYKDASMELRERLRKRSLQVPRGAQAAPEAREEVFIDASLFELLQVFRDVISSAREGPGIVIAPEKYSVVDKMRLVADILQKSERVRFRDLFESGADRGEIISALLAVLELVRLRMIRILQQMPGGEIYLMRSES